MRQPATLLLVLLSAACCGSATKAAEVTFESVNGVIDSSNYYVGPYSLKVDGTLYQTMCYDFVHPVAFGQTWTANLLSFDELDRAYYSEQPDYLSSYWQAGWLFNQLVATSSPEAMIGIQHAAWSLFNPETSPTDGAGGWLAASSDALHNHRADLDVSGFRVVNATGEGPTVQGFFIQSHAQFGTLDTAVPECATYAMLAAGLLLFALGSQRFRRMA